MLRAVVFLCLAAASHQIEITEFAVPSVIKSGENVELQCLHSLGLGEVRGGLFYVKWWRIVYSGERQLLYQRLYNMQPQLQHLKKWDLEKHVKPNDTIELLALQPRDSGLYICEVSNLQNSALSVKQEDRRDHNIVVYSPGTGPTMFIEPKSNVTEGAESKVLVRCHADEVAPKPTLGITIDGKVLNAATKVIKTDDELYNIVAETAVLRDEIVDKRVECELFYEDSNIGHEKYAISELYSDYTATDAAEALEATVPVAAETGTTLDDTETQPQTPAETDNAVGVTSCATIVALATALRLLL